MCVSTMRSKHAFNNISLRACTFPFFVRTHLLAFLDVSRPIVHFQLHFLFSYFLVGASTSVFTFFSLHFVVDSHLQPPSGFGGAGRGKFGVFNAGPPTAGNLGARVVRVLWAGKGAALLGGDGLSVGSMRGGSLLVLCVLMWGRLMTIVSKT